MDKAILTCALTGVLTNPKQHLAPITPAQMAAEARDAFNAGASIMQVHLRMQQDGMGHMPSWDPDVADKVVNAIRQTARGSSSTSPRGWWAKTLRALWRAYAASNPKLPPAMRAA